MPIIIKKGARKEPAPADVVPEALVPPVPPKERTKDDALKEWKDDPARSPNSKAQQCAYCKQWYIKPCSEEGHASCPNFKFLQASGREPASKS